MISLALDSQELAQQYDVVGWRQFEHGKLLISDLDVRPGHRVLDIGCGTGLLGAHVASVVGPDGKVFGIDPLPLRIELARKKAGASFEPSVGRAEDLSAFASESFDVVYLNSVVHWLPDQLGVFRQIHRVLRPGGKVGFTTADKERPHSFVLALERALRITRLEERSAGSAGSPHRLSSEEVGALLRAAGLRETQVLVRTITDHFPDVDTVLTFSRASSFGNHLASLSDTDQARVRDALASELERSRTAAGLEQRRHLIFAVAEKEGGDCKCAGGPPAAGGGGLGTLAARTFGERSVAPAAGRATAVHEVIASRRSIRKFRPDPVEDEKLARVLEAARLAPSARNFQPWHYVVVTDPEVRLKLRRAYDKEWFYDAPVIVCACGVPSVNPDRKGARDYRDVDVAISFDHLVLAATAEGLGTCWVGAFDPAAVREELGIPAGIEPIVMTPIGYPDEAPLPRERRPLDQILHRDRWGRP